MRKRYVHLKSLTFYCCNAEEDKRTAQAFSLAAVLLAAATTYLLLRISYAQAAFQTTMSKRDEGKLI